MGVEIWDGGDPPLLQKYLATPQCVKLGGKSYQTAVTSPPPKLPARKDEAAKRSKNRCAVVPRSATRGGLGACPPRKCLKIKTQNGAFWGCVKSKLLHKSSYNYRYFVLLFLAQKIKLISFSLKNICIYV